MEANETADGGGDVAITDRELFDNAVTDPSPVPASAGINPAPAGTETAPPPQGNAPPPASAGASSAPGQPRDEQGRFAAKPPGQPGQPAPPPPQPAPPPPTPGMAPPPADHRVPLRELLDERERRQRIEADATQMRQALQYFQTMQQQQALAAQQAQQPQTIFDNPDQYLFHNIIAPIREEGRREFLRMKDEWSREMAEIQHGEQRVNAALNDLAQIRRSPQGDFVFNQIMSSRHPYGALVKWHAQAQMHRQIGPDPRAWLQKEQERWLDDPKVQAAVVQRIQQSQKASNRPPTVNLPPSLSSLPASGGATDDAGDLSDASLYRFATR